MGSASAGERLARRALTRLPCGYATIPEARSLRGGRVLGCRSTLLSAFGLAALTALAACADLAPLQDPPRSAAVLTGGSWASMLYLARTDSGVIAIDLGTDGDGDALARAFAALGADSGDVVASFLTHSHRDHIAAWPGVAHAPIYLGDAEVPRLVGRSRHRGPLAGLIDRLVAPELPPPGRLELRPFNRDTAIVFGADTVRAFLLPGHTPGSAAYLFRGILFVGDAVTRTPLIGFHSARWLFSDDVGRSRASVAALRDRVADLDVRFVCTAHGKCAPASAGFWRAALR